MGGFLSGKGMRPTVMRRRRHYISEVPSINVRALDTKALSFVKGSSQVVVEIAGVCFCTTIKRHILPKGGRWYTFRCPLWAVTNAIALPYWSENRGKADRAVNMKWKYIHQISKEDYDAPLRPSGMHEKTYDRIMNKVARYDRLACGTFLRLN